MSTQTVTRPETDERQTTTGPEVFHYADKDKIVESAVMGTMVTALCGKVFSVTKTAKPGSPVCPECKEIYQDDGKFHGDDDGE